MTPIGEQSKDSDHTRQEVGLGGGASHFYRVLIFDSEEPGRVKKIPEVKKVWLAPTLDDSFFPRLELGTQDSPDG